MAAIAARRQVIATQAPDAIGANPTPFFRGGAPPTIIAGSDKNWWNGLTSSTYPAWHLIHADIQWYCVAFAINSLKSQVMLRRQYPMFASTERIRVISYMEAVLDPTCPVILGSYPGRVCPATPLVANIWPGQPPVPMRQGQNAMPEDHFWDCFVSHQGPIQGQAVPLNDDVMQDYTTADQLATALPNYTSAQFTFLISLAKRGDMTENFARKTQAGLAMEVDIEALEIYRSECRWIANRVVASANMSSPEWGALFASIIQAAPDVERVRKCPSQRSYEQSLMGGHFPQCLARGEMTPFPSRVAIARKIRSITDIEVYCSCRLQDNKQESKVECYLCHEWFHQSCQQVERTVFTTPKQGWHCRKCKR